MWGQQPSLVNGELCISNLTLIEIKDETYTFEGAKKEGSASSAEREVRTL